MKNILLYLFLVLLLYSCEKKAQIIIESQASKIEFKNWYKFNAAIDKKLESDNQPWKYQIALEDYANKGEFQKSQEIDDISIQKQASIPFTREQIDSINAKYTAVDAAKYIIDQAKRNKITIINEAHHNPRHRVFTVSLLKELYDAGYTHLGLEALYNGEPGGTPLGNGRRLLDEKDSLLNEREYPIRKSGAYAEPQLGNLMRAALEIGFTIFSYEKTGVRSGNPRELGQAKNIQKVVDENPAAKILIHCGYAHAYEGVGAFEPGGKAMAGQLKALTGINPLTINQVEYSEHSKPEYNAPLLNALNLENSSVLVDNSGNALGFIQNDAFTDIAIIHPPTKYLNARPSWLFQNGTENVEMDISFLDIDFPAMILAYKKGENIEQAIPTDILEVNDNTTSINLALKPGNYTMVVVNTESDARKFEISVK